MPYPITPYHYDATTDCYLIPGGGTVPLLLSLTKHYCGAGHGHRYPTHKYCDHLRQAARQVITLHMSPESHHLILAT